MDLTFSGAGFMGCYYFGVVDCWSKYIPRDRVNRAAGASAGSLIAAYYLMDLPLKGCLAEIIALTEEIRSRSLGVFDRSHQIVDVLPKMLDRLFPDDAHKQVSGRLFVCMTRLKDMKKVIVSEFESKKDLIDALNCSCFIPVWSGNHVATYKGVKHIDGGFTDNLPVFDEHTIRICCFAGQTDISPYDRVKSELLSSNVLNTPLYFNFANCRRARKALFPPPASAILDLLERGFHDAKQFILTNDLIQCQACYNRSAGLRDHPVFKSGVQSLTISPSVSPALSRIGSRRQLGALMGPCTISSNREIGSMGAENRLATNLSGFLNPNDGFHSLLSDKLKRSCSPDESLESQDLNNNSLPPAVVVSSDVDVDFCKQSDNNGAPKELDQENHINMTTNDIIIIKTSTPKSLKVTRPRKKSRSAATGGGQETTLAARRRSSLAVNQSQLLVVKDKFTLAPNPLPSCPPSPSLNRHCTECIRMRQEARVDLLEDEIRKEAEKYRLPQPPKEGRIKSKLASPLRWFRQLGTKHSYRFQQESVGVET